MRKGRQDIQTALVYVNLILSSSVQNIFTVMKQLPSEFCFLCTLHAEGTLTLKDLSNELEPVADWHTLGVRFGVEDHKLREIEEHYHDPQRRKSEMLSRWLR